MQAKRTKNMPQVHILTQRADMKFIPEIYEAPDRSTSQNRSSFSTRLKSFLGFSRSELNSSIQNASDSSFNQSQSSIFKPTNSELKGENQSSISVQGSEKELQQKKECKECKTCDKCQMKTENRKSQNQQKPADGPKQKQETEIKQKQEKKIKENVPKEEEQKQCSECIICQQCQKLEKEKSQISTKPKYSSPKLEFVVRIAHQFILIGNKHQLDLINVGNISDNKFIDTEYYWSFKFEGIIRAVAVDSKKMNVLAIIVDNVLKIYKYDYKKIPKQPFPIFKEVPLENPPFCMTMAKDGNICVFYQQRYEVYSVADQVRKRRSKRYEVFDVLDENPKKKGDSKLSENRFEIFTVPEPFENILNIFFSQSLENQKIFALWSIELEFQALEIKNSAPRKIYQIKNQYKQTLTLSNYARDIFLMNLRNEINAVKPGYVLDSANIRMNKGQEFLNYMGNDTLLHTSKKMIEVYNFSLNTQVKPSRIQIKAKDSIKIDSDLTDYEFFKILPVLNNENIIIFQIQPEKNKNKNGQVTYCMFLTKGISREEKINILFPKTNWKFQRDSQDLNERCDMARKMGLTVKQIYLQLWNRTEKCNKQDYEILISTNDYTTIKNEILRKLRKASMPFSQIWKIEQQCFLMLQNRIYNPGCTEQAIMEYISCHFFIRKLEMFKDQEYMEKRQRDKLKNILSKSTQIKQEEQKVQGKQNKEQKIQEKQENAEVEVEENIEKKEEKQENEKTQEKKEKKNGKGKKQQKKEEKDVIKMTIRQYQNLRAMQIKSELINEIGLYCDEKKGSAIKTIRFLLKTFKFVFRTIYYDLLEEIILKSQDKLYDLIVAVPQLLPYSPTLQLIQGSAEYPINFFEGVWPEINAREWKQSLYVDAITTIDNKEIMLDRVLKSLSFRRNFLSQHDMVAISKKEIELNAKKIKSEQTFFYFISKMFSCLKNEKLNKQNPEREIIIKNVQKQVIKFLQENYEMMPDLIKGKVFLIEKLYSFLESRNLLPQVNGKACALSQFLKFKDEQFIRHCFVEQRSIKGLILKQLKPLYEEACGPEQGKNLFNTALLNYFISDLSEVSDLKYILNRINNEKKEFHFENQKLYEILVEALERKLKIGTENDIPIQEVLIYIENIPFKEKEDEGGEVSKALKELQLVNSVNQEKELLQEARVNMNIYDILHKQDEVITKLVVYMIKEKNLICKENFQITEESVEKVKTSTIQIIGTLSSFSEEIYGETNSKRIFFIYLTKLCARAEMIKHACHLLKNPHIQECYDSTMADHIVQFLYKFKMSEEKIMINNEFYVNELLKLLPPDFVTRVYIESQMKYAKILSRPDQPYEYPINESAYTISDLRNQLLGLPIEFLLQIDLQELHKVIFQFQKIYYETSLAQQPQNFEFTPANFISLHQIYEILIIELLHARKLKQVLPFIQKILEQDVQVSQKQLDIKSNAPKTNYNIIYLILFITELSSEINEDNKNALISSISYYFYYPWDLLQILKSLMNQERTPREIKNFLDEKLEKGKKIKFGRQNQGYNPYSQVFNQDYLENISTASERQQFMNRLGQATRHMQESKQLFKDIKYAAIMTILCNSPYALAKLIVCSQKINVSAIRCFLSYAIREDVFNPLAILELGRRIFQFLLLSEQSLIPVELVIEEFADASLQDQCIEPDEKIKQAQLDNKLMKLWWRSAEAFKKKKEIVEKQQKSKLKAEQSQQKKSERIKKSLGDQSNLEKNEPNEYPFSKIDHDNEEEEIIDFRESQGLKKVGANFQFNADAEINMALDNTKKRNLFSSSRDDKYKSSGKLTMSIRGAKSSIDHHGAFFNSLGAAELKKGSSYKEKKQNIDLAESLKICESVHGSPRPESNNDQEQKNSVLKSVDMESEEVKSEKGEIEEGDPGYVIKINEVNEESEILEDQMQQIPAIIPRASVSPQQIAKNLIEINLSVLEASNDTFDFSEVKENKHMKEIAVEIYRQKPPHIKSINILNMIKVMTNSYPETGVSFQTLGFLIDIAHKWEKAVSDVPFTKLLSPQKILHNFYSKDELFEMISENICKYADPENIYKIGFFVKSGFRNQDYESRIYWNLIMNLCETLDTLEKEEMGNTLQKIEGILEKASIKIWNERFNEFTQKVLVSGHRQNIIEIFCKHLSKKEDSKDEAKQFLESLSAIDPSALIKQTLKQILYP